MGLFPFNPNTGPLPMADRPRATIRFGAMHNEITVTDKDRVEIIPIPSGGRNKAERESNSAIISSMAAAVCSLVGIKPRDHKRKHHHRGRQQRVAA